jgi:oxygen-independent coproporphyrinogen-3 oxidase
LPIDGKDAISKLIDPYVEALCKQIAERGTKMDKPQVNTIYFGGGTPTRIGADNLAKIIDTISAHFDIELLVELTIECNPFPQDEVLHIIETITRRYHTFGRIRRSIGIQTFDEEVLQQSGRLYSFPAICDFLRKLRSIKQINNIYNLDFIAFGKRNTDAQ